VPSTIKACAPAPAGVHADAEADADATTDVADNAAMIAWAGILRLQHGARGERFGLPIRPRWSLEALYDDLD
jgi:tRNA A37 threonylcarbamoyltransferase TsaD